MLKAIKQGCFTITGLSFVISVMGLFLAALAVRNDLAKLIDDFRQNTANFSSAMAVFLTSPLIPLWLFAFVFLFAVIGIWWIIKTLTTNQATNSGEWVKFRDLWFWVEWHKDHIPHVVNRTIENAKCGYGDCMQSIVGTDNQGLGGWVSYLKCKDGHFVGNEEKYEDYDKRLRETFAKQRQQRQERSNKAKVEYERLQMAKDKGEISEKEFEDILNSPAESDLPAFSLPDVPPAFNAREFYTALVNDFEQEHIRQAFKKSLNPSVTK